MEGSGGTDKQVSDLPNTAGGDAKSSTRSTRSSSVAEVVTEVQKRALDEFRRKMLGLGPLSPPPDNKEMEQDPDGNGQEATIYEQAKENEIPGREKLPEHSSEAKPGTTQVLESNDVNDNGPLRIGNAGKSTSEPPQRRTRYRGTTTGGKWEETRDISGLGLDLRASKKGNENTEPNGSDAMKGTGKKKSRSVFERPVLRQDSKEYTLAGFKVSRENTHLSETRRKDINDGLREEANESLENDALLKVEEFLKDMNKSLPSTLHLLVSAPPFLKGIKPKGN